MEIKNLFEMAKTDRYTADGRAQIEDARKTYQIGEISQATGLQKTANGWVQPKTGAGAQKQGVTAKQKMKREDEKYEAARKDATMRNEGSTKKNIAKNPKKELELWEKSAKRDAELSGENQVVYQDKNGNCVIYAESDSAGEEKAEAHGYKKMSLVRPDGSQKAMEAAAEGKRDVSAENRAFHEKADKERAERETRANNQASAARKEAEARGLAGVEMKDLFLAKTFEGASVSIAQRGLEAQGFDLLEANDKVNVYERPEGGRITFKLEGNKIKSADYQTPAETAHEGRELPKPIPKREEIGKFYTKFNDAQDAYDAGRQTFSEGGYTIFKTPEGNYKVVDDPKTKQRMQDAGYEVEVDVPDGTKPPKGPIHDSAPLTGDTKIRVRK